MNKHSDNATVRFPFGLPPTDNATALRASAKTKPAAPDRRSVGETELHYLWIQLFYSSLKNGEAGTSGGRAGFVMANSASDARSSQQELRRQLIESRAVDVMVAGGANLFTTPLSNNSCGMKMNPGNTACAQP